MRQGITDAVKHLLIINVLMFIGTMSIGNGQLFFEWFALYFPKHQLFQPWQVLTHMFMHANGSHILYNMLLLFIAGVFVERVLGTKKFLFIYLSSGLGAALLTVIVDYVQFNLALNDLIAAGYNKTQILETLRSGAFRYDAQWETILTETKLKYLVLNYGRWSVGASGAIMGILAVLGLMIPNREIFLLFPPIPIKIKYLVVGMIGSDFISVFLTGTPLLGHSNTNYLAHVGGAFTGAAIYLYWKKNNMNKYRWDK